MIFPTVGETESRVRLTREMASGAITAEEGCRRILQSNPDDASALQFFAETALEAGDFAETERYARHLIRVHPLGYGGYLLLSRALGEAGPASPLSIAYSQAAVERLQHDEIATERTDLDTFSQILGGEAFVTGLPKPEALTRIAEVIQAHRTGEPAHVAQELEPHRLILQLYDSSDDLLDPGAVDAILRHGEGSAPLLLGVLKEWGAGMLTGEDRPLVERSLALLGEIGDPAALPAIAEFLLENDDDLSGPADWAFHRIAFQHPEAVLDRIRAMIPEAGGAERLALSQQIATMPGVPGKSELLTSLTGGIGHLPRDEQQAVVIGAIAGVMLLEGGDSSLAASLEKQFADLLDGKARSDLRNLRLEARTHGPLVAQASDYTIHQICCEAPDADDAGPAPMVPRAPKPGRNDPCWCGSGKKYKKCHLDRDERR
jgi:hypothetical protein